MPDRSDSPDSPDRPDSPDSRDRPDRQDWQRLAGLLLDAGGDQVAANGRPTWVVVLDDPDRPDGFGLSFYDEPDGLLGWVAPPECQAVGVIATGRLSTTGSAGGPGGVGEEAPPDWVAAAAAATASAGGPEGARLQLACLVARDGSTGWQMRLPGGVETDHPPSEGRLLDCLRRCLGLPTAPAPASPALLQAAAWLAAVLEASRRSARLLTWSEVTRLHPLARVVAGDLAADGSPLLPVLTRVAAAAWSWEELRRQVPDLDGVGGLVDPALAAWMDEGMFARWVLSALPSTAEMLASVRPGLAPSAARRLAHAIRAITEVPAAHSA